MVAGAVTDIGALRRRRLPVFSLGASAFTTRSLGLAGQVNLPVSVGGVEVQPGDLAIGDDDGVFILGAQQLLPELLAKEQADQLRREELLHKLAARRP